MVLRTRVIDRGSITGTALDALIWRTDTATLGREECNDELTLTVERRDKPLTISKVVRSGGIHNGRTSLAANRTEFNNYPILDSWITARMTALPSLSALESEGAAALRAAALSNPSRNDFQLPVFLWELKDLPELIRQAGRLFFNQKRYTDGTRLDYSAFMNWYFAGAPKKGVDAKVRGAASAYLAVNFGIAPLVSDLKKMILFTDAVEKRKKELARLVSGEGLRRRITLTQKAGVAVVANQSSQSQLPALRVTAEMQSSIKRWATMRWKPSRNPMAGSLPKTDQDVRNVILGLNASSVAGHLWEALPWSWMIDYFARVGDLIGAANNAVGAELVSSCVMTTSIRSLATNAGTYTNTSNGVTYTCSVSPLEYAATTKSRYISKPGISDLQPRFALLTDRQTSILGALAVMRHPR